MFRREFFVIVTVAAIIFLAVAGAGWFAVAHLRAASTQLVQDTLPGLMDAGAASERMHENRHRMRLMLESTNADACRELITEVSTNSTEKLWQDYAQSIYEPNDARNYSNLIAVRKEYLGECQRFFELVTNGNKADAAVFFNGQLGDSFKRYNDAANTLFTYNVRQGVERGDKILVAARYTPLAVAALTVIVFFVGFLLGLRFILTGQLPAPDMSRQTHGATGT
ncbi:MAG TPA: MCP four helix bundle domain-containing protein [Verrucomicrobiae bacterium]